MFNFHTHIKQNNAIVNIDSVDDFIYDENCFYSLGNHPWNEKMSMNKLKKAIKNNKNIVALGECGLDKLKSEYFFDKQIEVLQEQINLSEQIKMPIILHVVKAFNEIIKLKKERQPIQKWVIHGFRNYKHSEDLLQNGFYLSFGEHLLKNEALQQSFIGIDLDRIFIETDDSNADIKNLYKFAADLKRMEVDELVNQIRKNLKTITNGRLA